MGTTLFFQRTEDTNVIGAFASASAATLFLLLAMMLISKALVAAG